MISFYQQSPSQQSIQRKPDELSFLSDNEEPEEIGFKNKVRRDSNLTATDSAYFSESSTRTSPVIKNDNVISPGINLNNHQNVILWQKQQQHYQEQNSDIINNNQRKGSIISPLSRMPTPESSPLSEPSNDYWETISDNNSIKSSTSTINNNKLKYSSPRLSNNELIFNNPEQRAHRIHLRMSQWKRKLEQMDNQMVYNRTNSGLADYSYRNFPNRNRSISQSNSSIDPIEHIPSASMGTNSNIDPAEHISSAQSVYSVATSSIFDEKYDSFAEDDRDSVFSLRNRSITPTPRSHSSLDFRNSSSKFYSNSLQKENKIQILQMELENSKLVYSKKVQQLDQMKSDLEQYQFKLEEVREKEIEQAKQQAIEELEQTTIKNLKLEIDALQCKLEETVTELEHSKTYADMLRNEVLILKMNEQNIIYDNIEEEEFGGADNSSNELTLMENTSSKQEAAATINKKIEEVNDEKVKSLEEVIKQKDIEIENLKRKLERSNKTYELSKKEIVLLNKKINNHKQAREDIESRHTKLVDIASANEIELNRLRYKIEQLNHNKNVNISEKDLNGLKQINSNEINTLSVTSDQTKIIKANKNNDKITQNNNIKHKGSETSTNLIGDSSSEIKNSNEELELNNQITRNQLEESNETITETRFENMENNDNSMNYENININDDDDNIEVINKESDFDDDINDILNELSLSDLEFDENDNNFNLESILNSETLNFSSASDVSIFSDLESDNNENE